MMSILLRGGNCKGLASHPGDVVFIVCLFFMLWEADLLVVAPIAVPRGGGGVLPYMGYIGMCGPKGYGFSAVLVINRVSIIAILPPLWS